MYRRKLPKIKGRKEMYVKLKLKFIFGGTRFTMHNNNSPSPFVLWLCSPFFYIFFFIFSTSISLKMGIKKEQKTTVEINLHKKQRNVVINSSFFFWYSFSLAVRFLFGSRELCWNTFSYETNNTWCRWRFKSIFWLNSKLQSKQMRA